MQRRHLAALGATGLGFALIRDAAAQELRQRALMGGIYTMRLAELGMQHGESPLVKQFAGFEMAEQRGILEALKIAGAGGIESAIELERDQQADIARVAGARGRAFDQGFVQAQLEGHRELAATQGAILRGGGSREDRIIAAVAVPAIEQHMEMLRGIAAALRA